jgi:hypothetical protein
VLRKNPIPPLQIQNLSRHRTPHTKPDLGARMLAKDRRRAHRRMCSVTLMSHVFARETSCIRRGSERFSGYDWRVLRGRDAVWELGDCGYGVHIGGVDVIAGRNGRGLRQAELVAQFLLRDAVGLLSDPGVDGAEARDGRAGGDEAVTAELGVYVGVAMGIVGRLWRIRVRPAESTDSVVGPRTSGDGGAVEEELLERWWRW